MELKIVIYQINLRNLFMPNNSNQEKIDTEVITKSQYVMKPEYIKH